jgi:hypothetical protein
MDYDWPETFRRRMHEFEAGRARKPGEVPVSIKIRVVSGCFHREHSPRAYELIDRDLAKVPTADSSFAFEEHENGPEILVYLAVTTAGLSLAKSIVSQVRWDQEGRPPVRAAGSDRSADSR